jgi:hypothetical protein
VAALNHGFKRMVESKSGKIACDLSVDDFSIKDDGVEQRISLAIYHSL